MNIIDVDWLSNVIRAAGGNNQLGAGALAEKVAEALNPKVDESLRQAHALGFIRAAKWAGRSDLIADVDSPAYESEQHSDLQCLKANTR